jgi:hypothetical protein
VVSRTWRKVKGDWEAWNGRSLADEPIIRLILDGTIVRVRLDKKATSISLLVALGVRADGQKVLLAVKNMGGESEAAWRALLDDLVKRGLKTPELVIVDGAPGLEKALAALWSDVAVQRCTVHKHRNLLAHAPDRLHEEISNDYRDMIYAETKQEVEAKRKAFIRKWRVKCLAVALSLGEAGDKLFTFTRFPPSQWKSIRTSNAILRLHEEFKRRIKTQAVLPCAETAAMLFWALLASGQITMRKVEDGKASPKNPTIRSLTSPLDRIASCRPQTRQQFPTQSATGPRGRRARCLDRFPDTTDAMGRKVVHDHNMAGAEFGGAGPACADCLNAHWFLSVDDARAKMEDRWKYYNEDRPHAAIGNKSPTTLQIRDGAPPPATVKRPENSNLQWSKQK